MYFITIICKKYNIGINQTTENLSQLYLGDWDIAKVVSLAAYGRGKENVSHQRIQIH